MLHQLSFFLLFQYFWLLECFDVISVLVNPGVKTHSPFAGPLKPASAMFRYFELEHPHFYDQVAVGLWLLHSYPLMTILALLFSLNRRYP